MSRKLLTSIAAAVTFLAAPAALACSEHGHAKGETAQKKAAPKKSLRKVSVKEVAQLREEKKVTLLDVNNPAFRSQHGVIPGARLLSHFTKYDVAKELPAGKDAKLVFYCANTQCTASHAAAKRALEAGFTDVSVLPAGLLGWKEAGQATAPATPQS